MHALPLILILLVIATILAEYASKFRISYPILLVLVGMVISWVPGLKELELPPDVVFLIFLPPLLYAAAWTTNWPDFRASARPITLLAIGCVLFTTTAVAWVAQALIPGFGWAEGFLLGAILSPPDAVAATAGTKGLGIPRRVIAILEGESLVNDATGLTAFRYALAAVLTGAFSLWKASGAFLWVAGGGIAIGLALGYVVRWIHLTTPQRPRLDTSLTLLTPFVSYLLAEELHASGVLSVVATGLFLSRYSGQIFNHSVRITANAVWDVVTYLLNGIVFVFIGLHLPVAAASLQDGQLKDAHIYGAVISATVIVGRILWVFPAAYLPGFLSRRIRAKEGRPDWRLVSLTAWAGMRGVVSLAAALAVPATLANGQPFPFRDLIFFITFCVIFATLVLQGLTLPFLIRWLGIGNAHDDQEVHRARLSVASSAVEYIEENLSYNTLPDEVLALIKSKYEIRIGQLNKRLGQASVPKLDDAQTRAFLHVQLQLLAHERERILALRRSGVLDEEAIRQLDYELDLEEARVQLDLEETE